AIASLLAVVLIVASATAAHWVDTFAWAAAATAAGLVLIWRNGPPAEREALQRAAEPVLRLGPRSRSRRGLAARLVAGAALLLGGVAAITIGHQAVLQPLAGVALVAAGCVVVFGPWWFSVGRDLVVERQARVRAEERAEVAARLHDSVLQTLALIQRDASSPGRVAQLARAQERELRSWLFGGPAPSGTEAATTLAAALRSVQEEVEAGYGTRVDLVTVGDCSLDDRVTALVAAAREAVVNAAKWSGADTASVYAEVTDGEVEVFVRDRGCGFDPAAVAPDRRGLEGSVHGRMARHGGTAQVRSEPGAGTEVALRMRRVPVAS
ncbi:MAG TPA: ATP-binding protein, partial [Acidimicrobiales bacterium]|nr:ATP-binding protein [Acidimicrobiales bacterium]